MSRIRSKTNVRQFPSRLSRIPIPSPAPLDNWPPKSEANGIDLPVAPMTTKTTNPHGFVTNLSVGLVSDDALIPGFLLDLGASGFVGTKHRSHLVRRRRQASNRPGVYKKSQISKVEQC